MNMSPRAFVGKLPFVTSFGHGTGPDSRAALGLKTLGPTKVITDLCILEPDRTTRELTVVSLYPGVSPQDVQDKCDWPLRFADNLSQTPVPRADELQVFRDLEQRTRRAHGEDA